MVRRRNLFIASALASMAIGATSASAAPTINFETTAAGTPTVPGAAVGADYAPLGVNFTGAYYFRCGGGCPDPAYGTFVSGEGTQASFTALFDGVTNAFGFDNVSNSGGTASAFGTDGALLQSLNFSGFPSTYSFGVTGIHSVKFSTQSAFGVDNFNFKVTSAVPEPATWALMLLGFGGIGFSMRRRKVQPKVSFA